MANQVKEHIDERRDRRWAKTIAERYFGGDIELGKKVVNDAYKYFGAGKDFGKDYHQALDYATTLHQDYQKIDKMYFPEGVPSDLVGELKEKVLPKFKESQEFLNTLSQIEQINDESRDQISRLMQSLFDNFKNISSDIAVTGAYITARFLMHTPSGIGKYNEHNKIDSDAGQIFAGFFKALKKFNIEELKPLIESLDISAFDKKFLIHQVEKPSVNITTDKEREAYAKMVSLRATMKYKDYEGKNYTFAELNEMRSRPDKESRDMSFNTFSISNAAYEHEFFEQWMIAAEERYKRRNELRIIENNPDLTIQQMYDNNFSFDNDIRKSLDCIIESSDFLKDFYRSRSLALGRDEAFFSDINYEGGLARYTINEIEKINKLTTGEFGHEVVEYYQDLRENRTSYYERPGKYQLAAVLFGFTDNAGNKFPVFQSLRNNSEQMKPLEAGLSNFHEFGHVLDCFFSRENLPGYMTSGPFINMNLLETPSMANELMSFSKITQQNGFSSEQESNAEQFKMSRSFNQVYFTSANYDFNVRSNKLYEERRDAGIPFTIEDMRSTFMDSFKNIYGKDMVWPDKFEMSWARARVDSPYLEGIYMLPAIISNYIDIQYNAAESKTEFVEKTLKPLLEATVLDGPTAVARSMGFEDLLSLTKKTIKNLKATAEENIKKLEATISTEIDPGGLQQAQPLNIKGVGK